MNDAAVGGIFMALFATGLTGLAVLFYQLGKSKGRR